MGGLCTSCRPQVPKDRNSSIKHHGSFLHRRKNISAAFSFETTTGTGNLPEGERNVPTHNDPLPTILSTVDINAATEEDLMTLPMIGRAIAHNIVEYRKQIGGFRRVEDLVLVNGVGATKLEKLKKEIHVSDTTKFSRRPSLSGSESSILININSASPELLSSIEGISVELALKIVSYRIANGKFYHINDLVEPAGLIDIHALLKLKGSITTSNTNGRHSRNVSSASLKLRSASTSNFFGSGPECIESHRERVGSLSDKRNGRPIVRIATWNLQQCSVEKVKNPGVREVMCATVLENGIKILVVQELADSGALEELANELNSPSLPNIQRLKLNSGVWKYAISSTAAGRMFQGSEYNGFLWDSSAGIDLQSSALLEKSKQGKDFVKRPFLGYFKIKKADVVLVSVHLKAIGYTRSEKDLDSLNEEIQNLPVLIEALQKHVPEEKDLMILGDFNMEPNKSNFDVLRKKSFQSLIPENIPTNISTKNLKGSRSFDNIWLNKNATKLYTGQYQVVRTGLTNPWIPDGWQWGGVASDHCPVWAEFYVDYDFDEEAANKSLEGIYLQEKII